MFKFKTLSNYALFIFANYKFRIWIELRQLEY